MADLTLFHMVPSRSSIVHWMLEEVGEPYDLKVLDGGKAENRQSDYLAINPMGKVPALRHGDVVTTEAAAICCYLADAFPSAGLSIPIGDRRRGPYLKWLFFGPSCLEPAIMDFAFKRAETPPKGAVGWGDYDTVMDVLAKAAGGDDYLMGPRFTAADVVIGSGLRWGLQFRLVPERPEFSRYVARIEERPALRRAAAQDAEIAARLAKGG